MKCMPKISAFGLFCLDEFEKNQTRTCTTFFRTSKLTEVYFREALNINVFSRFYSEFCYLKKVHTNICNSKSLKSFAQRSLFVRGLFYDQLDKMQNYKTMNA